LLRIAFGKEFILQIRVWGLARQSAPGREVIRIGITPIQATKSSLIGLQVSSNGSSGNISQQKYQKRRKKLTPAWLGLKKDFIQ
jgi:hypothetical protein